MDLAYNPHAERARRKNRSSTNLNHLSLAPLTVKLPLSDQDLPDHDAAASPFHSTSYLQGKSAPTTPRLISRSPGPRARHHHRNPSAPSSAVLPKSKSSSHLHSAAPLPPRHSVSGTATPIGSRRRHDAHDHHERADSDWLYRVGAVMTSEAREFKGQAWLETRQSSTSLAGMKDADEAAFEAELARERDITSRMASRRGSSALADDESTPNESRLVSRSNSRSRSSRPAAHQSGYFFSPVDEQDTAASGSRSIFSGADFVNLDEKLEELERDTSQDDEAVIKRLVKRGQAADGSWLGNVLGWSLFSVEENPEDSEEDEEDDEEDSAATPLGRSEWASRHFEGVSNAPDGSIPLPKQDEGGWQDAAWLLSVASKVMF